MVSEREKQAGANGPLIEVLGWYDRNNCGDESFKLAFKEIFPGAQIRFITENPSPDSILILGGGDVIKSFYLDKIPKDRAFYALGVGLGYQSEILLLDSRCEEIYFRNFDDVTAAKAGMFDGKVYKCPDLAFAIPKLQTKKYPRTKKRLAVILANSAIHPKITAKEMSEVSYQDYLKWEIAKSLDYLSEWYDIHFVPFSDQQYAFDSAMHQDVFSRMKTASGVFIHKGDPRYPMEVLRVIGQFDLVLSMKLHGLIFATIMGVPFVNIGLSRKTALYAEETGMNSCSVSPYSFTRDRLMSAVNASENSCVSENLASFTAERFDYWQLIANRLRSHWLGQ